MSRVRSAVVFLMLAASARGAFAVDLTTLREYEAQALHQVRAEGYRGMDLVELARVRTMLGKHRLAIDTWATLKALHGQDRFEDQAGRMPPHSYGVAADFHIRQLRHRLALAARPPVAPDLATRGRMGEAAANVVYHFLAGRAGQATSVMQLDLDGDLRDEVVVVGWFGRANGPHQPFVFLARWNGQDYQVVWRAIQADFAGKFPVEIDALDPRGLGWKSLCFVFAWNTEDVLTLEYDGEDVLPE